MSVELQVVENAIAKVLQVIAGQRSAHEVLVKSQGDYDLAQEATQDALKVLRDELAKVE